MRWLFAFMGFALAPTPLWAQRVELPIREVDLSDGTRRYAVTVEVDGKPVVAGLDTGSTGLRILPRALRPQAAAARGEHVRYAYGAGTQFDGSAIRVGLGAGAVAATVVIQRIEKVGCTAAKPECPAGKLDPAQFGIQGDGLPGEGFDAILGIRLRREAVDNPFVQLGARQWIVELPRPGEVAGRVVLNPTADEVAAYRQLGVDDDGTTVGCIAGPAPLGKLCGRTYFDTGAPGLRIVGGPRVMPWPNGTQAQLAIGDGRAIETMPVEIGRRDQASGMFYEPSGGGQARLSFGLAPYFHWSVLYAADRHMIGLKLR